MNAMICRETANVDAVLDPKGTARNIEKHMAENGWSKKDMQKMLHLASTQSVYKWGYGNMPSLDNLIRMAVLFGTTLDELVAYQIIYR